MPKPDGYFKILCVKGECEFYCRAYKHLHKDIQESTEQIIKEVLGKDADTEVLVGDGMIYQDIDELARERFVTQKAIKDKERQALLAPYLAKRQARREERERNEKEKRDGKIQ